jgi:tripartite-type tricarboxylate transporter receptor subunit TctC
MIIIPKREFFRFNILGVILAALSLFFGSIASAQSYPSKPIRLIVPFAPGGSMDLLARIISIPMSKELGQNVIIDNVVGANGNIGTEAAARARPDGYTIVLISDSNVISPSLKMNLNYDLQRDFVPISFLVSGAHVLVSSINSKITSIQELIDYSKKNPGALFYATPGSGSAQHLGMEVFKERAGKLDIGHVPFKGGGQAITSVVGGQVQLGLLGFTPTLPFIKDKKLNALAATGKSRESKLPGIPTLNELGFKDFLSQTWYAAVVPAGTPQSVVSRLHSAFSSALAAPGVLERLAESGMLPDASISSSHDLQRFIENELSTWPKVVKSANIKLE